jgi:hypothetical protein
MKRANVVVLFMLCAAYCVGQTPAAPAGVAHGSFPAKVIKTLDSSKLKEGDTVELETAGSFKLPDGTLVPKGSQLVGHVTAAKARSKGDSDSQLAITFDKLNIMNGKQLPIKGVVQAVFPPADAPPDPQMAGKASGAAGGGYEPGGGNPTVGVVTAPPKIGYNAKPGSNPESEGESQTTMDPKSVGVQGMRNLDLSDGVLSSKGKQVKLGDGVRMIVRVNILGQP